jgi:hypothetical protein
MPARGLTPLQDLIDWKFTLREQHASARYGVYAGSFWRQYLPGGMTFPEMHPPKRIQPQVYRMAERQWSKE